MRWRGMRWRRRLRRRWWIVEDGICHLSVQARRRLRGTSLLDFHCLCRVWDVWDVWVKDWLKLGETIPLDQAIFHFSVFATKL